MTAWMQSWYGASHVSLPRVATPITVWLGHCEKGPNRVVANWMVVSDLQAEKVAMRPFASGLSTMMRSLNVGSQPQQKKPKKRLSFRGMRPSESKEQIRDRKRLRNHALTEGEFIGGILCHLDNIQNIDNQSDSDSSDDDIRQPSPTERQTQTSRTTFGRVLLPSSQFFKSRKKNPYMCCHAHRSPPVIDTKHSDYPLPPYPRQQRVGDCNEARKVRFTASTKPGTPDGMPRKRPTRVSARAIVAEEQDFKRAQTEVEKLSDAPKKTRRSLQRKSSLEDLMSSLRRDRRRTHNFAMTEEDFEKSILPELMMMPE